jgi:hypothetical protein
MATIARATRLAVPAVLIFVVVSTLMIGRPVQRADEAWFLWVAHRTSNGDVLYRDVYFVSTPLAAWIGMLLVRVFGTTLLAVRALPVAVFALVTVTAWVLAARAGLGRAGRVALVLALVAYGSPLVEFQSAYAAVAMGCALGAFVLVWRWLDDTTARRDQTALLAAAGLACGLSIAAKPNVGVLALLAVSISLIAHRGRLSASRRELAWVWGVTVGVVGLVLVPIVWSGGFSKFVDYVVREKSDYWSVMSRGPLPGIGNSFAILPGNGGIAGSELASRWYSSVRLVPLVTIPVVAWAAWCIFRRSRARAVTLVAFFVAALATALPSAGPQHLDELMALLLPVVAVTIAEARRSVAMRPAPLAVIGALLAAWLAFGAVLVVTRPIRGLGGRSGVVASALPHLDGDPIQPAEEQAIERDARTMRAITGGAVLIVRPDASFYYLAGGLRDPTAFDYPTETDFGAHGEGDVVRLIRRGQVPFACIHHEHPTTPDRADLRPLALIHAVERYYVYVGPMRVCRLYRAPGATLPSLAAGHGG